MRQMQQTGPKRLVVTCVSTHSLETGCDATERADLRLVRLAAGFGRLKQRSKFTLRSAVNEFYPLDPARGNPVASQLASEKETE